MIDSNSVALFQVTTGNLNKAIKRIFLDFQTVFIFN